ncbi:MAG: hypothetical protein ACTTKH_05960 [Treponema sp.]
MLVAILSCGHVNGKNGGKTPDNNGKKPDNNGGKTGGSELTLYSLKFGSVNVDIKKIHMKFRCNTLLKLLHQLILQQCFKLELASFTTLGGVLKAGYAEKDEDKVANLIPISNKTRIGGGLANATKVPKDKFIYLQLVLKDGYIFDKFEAHKEGDTSTKVTLEMNDVKGFPKEMKDKGYQARFKIQDYDVKMKIEVKKK